MVRCRHCRRCSETPFLIRAGAAHDDQNANGTCHSRKVLPVGTPAIVIVPPRASACWHVLRSPLAASRCSYRCRRRRPARRCCRRRARGCSCRWRGRGGRRRTALRQHGEEVVAHLVGHGRGDGPVKADRRVVTKSRGCPGDHLEDLVAKAGRRAGTVVFEDEDGGADFSITVSSSSTAAPIHRAASALEQRHRDCGASRPQGRPLRRGNLPGEGRRETARRTRTLSGAPFSSPRLEGKEFLVIDGHGILASDIWDREAGRCPRGR